MKTELWSKVKRGDYLIYADETDGVQKVKVTEIDIAVETLEPEYKKEQPYGLTAEKGYVRIYWKADGIEYNIVENLANLIRFNLTWYTKLKKAYDDWQKVEASARTYKETFIRERAELKEK